MNEELEKKEWAKPEIVDLDVEETAGGHGGAPTESFDRS
jgi:hypothetical protein